MLRSSSSCNIQLHIASGEIYTLWISLNDTPSAIAQISVVGQRCSSHTHCDQQVLSLLCWLNLEEWPPINQIRSLFKHNLKSLPKRAEQTDLKGLFKLCDGYNLQNLTHTEHTEIMNNKAICCRCHSLHALINSCSIYCGLISESLHILIKLKITTTTQLTVFKTKLYGKIKTNATCALLCNQRLISEIHSNLPHSMNQCDSS